MNSLRYPFLKAVPLLFLALLFSGCDTEEMGSGSNSDLESNGLALTLIERSTREPANVTVVFKVDTDLGTLLQI